MDGKYLFISRSRLYRGGGKEQLNIVTWLATLCIHSYFFVGKITMNSDINHMSV